MEINIITAVVEIANISSTTTSDLGVFALQRDHITSSTRSVPTRFSGIAQQTRPATLPALSRQFFHHLTRLAVGVSTSEDPTLLSKICQSKPDTLSGRFLDTTEKRASLAWRLTLSKQGCQDVIFNSQAIGDGHLLQSRD